MNSNVRRSVIVTGGASGIGAATVRHFIGQGWNVAVNYFAESEREAADALVSEAQAAGSLSLAILGDVSKDEDCRRMAREFMARFGRIDALISSAGTTRVVPQADLDGLTAQDFLTTTSVNTIGPFQMVRAFADDLKAGGGGAVVIVSSYGGLSGGGSSIAYAASKGATNTLTLSLARLLAPEIRVNAVCPAIVTNGLAHRLNPSVFESRIAAQIDKAPLRRVGKPEEIAADIYWLAAAAPLVTGSVLMLDAGLHLNMDG